MKYYIIILSIIVFIIVCYMMYKMKYKKESMENKKESTEVESVIPLDIYQTWQTKELPPKMKICVDKLKRDNPEFTHYLYDNDECRAFIKDNFDNDVLYAFDKLIPGAFKADLWRYCILYKKGGIYLDIKFQCENNFKLIELVNKEHYILEKPFHYSKYKYTNTDKQILDYMCSPNYLNDFEKHIDKSFWIDDNFGIYNGLMVCKKNNPILLDCINQIVINVKNNYYGKMDISITGPVLLGKFYFKKFPNNYQSFDIGYSLNDKTLIDFKQKKVILSKYPEYYNEMEVYSTKEPYSKLWHKKKVYND